MKILFIVPYPLGESPSQRFRFEQYLKALNSKGYAWKLDSFLSPTAWTRLYDPNKNFLKTIDIIVGILRRTASLFSVIRYDFVFIHREVAPMGPPVFEWIIAKVLRKKIIYDFDDAIWLTDRVNESVFFRIFKWRSKVQAICRWSYKVSSGNEYLRSYAAKFNKQVVLNPTTIDTQRVHNPDVYSGLPKTDSMLVIGWTGSHSTLKYLQELESVLQKIESDFPAIQILVIADKKPDLKLKSLLFIPWNEKTEIEDLMRIDIGIMPLPDDEWAKGKCGFKALQYMALKMPAVASPVGVNSQIIDEGINGFLCSTPEHWESSLIKLINDASLRKQMGENGRQRIVDHYSVASNSSNFLSLFE